MARRRKTTTRRRRRNPVARRRRNPVARRRVRRRRNTVSRRRNTGMTINWTSALIGAAVAYWFHNDIAKMLGGGGPAAGWGALQINRQNPLHINRGVSAYAQKGFGAVYDPYAGFRR